jgi:hypothetical protein
MSMQVRAFLAADRMALVRHLATQDAQRYRRNEPQQLRAWRVSLDCLHAALANWPAAAAWELLLEYPMRRLGRRIDAVLVTERAVLVLEFKVAAERFDAADRRQVEDYALDLQDFHPLSRRHPIVPILVATDAIPASVAWPLPLAGVTTVLDASAATLRPLLRAVWELLPPTAPPLEIPAWKTAPYRPVPGIVDAACTLYSRHGVADIAAARADARNLSVTTEAILAAIDGARAAGGHSILFVTGIPGAGKTLCGLNAVLPAATPAPSS